MKRFLWLILTMILVSCAQNTQQKPAQEIKPAGNYYQVPGWYRDFPQGDYCLGTARLTFFETDVKTAARQNATINYSRNQNCYVVNNEAIRRSSEYENIGKSEFQVIVSSETDELRELYKRMQLIDHFWLYDSFIGLYSIAPAVVDTARYEVWINEEPVGVDPGWFKQGLKISNGMITADARAGSHDLLDACESCFNAGRVLLAGYNDLRVNGSTLVVNGLLDNLISLETLVKMNQIHIQKISIRRYLGSGGPGYEVHLRLAMETYNE